MTTKLCPIGPFELTNVIGEDYDCPHCGRRQIVGSVYANFGACHVQVRQCISCNELQVEYVERFREGLALADRAPSRVLHPSKKARPPALFQHVPSEIVIAYHEACGLFAVHTGAAGAYARRALELVLDGLGYEAKALADSIKAAKAEEQGDRRLPARLLARLDYIKEIGNFALHIRRDQELAIIEIDATEVEACLETIEELLTYVFEEPGRDYERAVDLNKRLVEAKKKPIPLPDGPGAHWKAPSPEPEADAS